MTTNKERIERLEEGLGGVQAGIHRMEIAKLEFPRFSGDDPTEWLNRVDQFFEFQEIVVDQKVLLASFHLEAFEDEVRVRFGLPDYEDFDEVLSRVRQTGTLRNYQREFERVGNRVRGWTQKALVGALQASFPISNTSPPKGSTQVAIKRLSWDEMQKRRAQGLYETLDEMGVVNMTREMSKIEKDDNGKEPEITLHALTGWTVPRAMRIKAIIGVHKVVALIDSGSTHNFIIDRVAETLHLPVKPTTSFTVRVTDGERLSCKGKYEKLMVNLQGNEFHLDFFFVPLNGLDMVNNEELSSDMQALLEEYSDVFAALTSLPPAREIDHKILLQDGTKAINVRPHSLFSSPILLVKKNDGTWQFCTDYRALNATTVKDRFPIPTVDDMLDELHGAAFFLLSWISRQDTTKYELAPLIFLGLLSALTMTTMSTWLCHLGYATHHLPSNPTWEQHLEHAQLTFSIIRQHQFYVKISKCAFDKKELEYLGHIITHRGIKVDEKKIDAMVAWPKPSNIIELCGFLGLTGYYRKFVQGYGLVAQPLTNLLKKWKFLWNEEAESTFLALKQAMTSTPTLAMSNFTEPFSIKTDASRNGIGVVLTQKNKPIAYISRALGITKQTWSIYAKEMLAIRVSTPEQQKLVAKLLGYDYEIIFRPGRDNSAADALSRRQESPLFAALHFSDVDIWKQIREASKSDFYMQFLGKKASDPPRDNLNWRDGLLLYKGNVVVPVDHSLRAKLLYEVHDSKVGGHSGILQTYRRLQQQFYWPKMHKSVCSGVWEDIILDFIEGLPSSHGKDIILVIVNRLSKFAHFIPLTHPFTAKVVAEKFIEGVVKLHGMPRSIISDRDPIFISKFWQEFFKLSGSKLMLKYWYNTTYHALTKMTPYQALYGRLPPLLPTYPEGLSPIHEVDKTLLHRDELLHQLKTNLEISMNRMKKQADSNRRDIQFKVARIHPVFHVSLLKPYNGTPAVTPLDLPPLADDGVITLEPQQILDTRWIKRNDTFMEESLVH
ncbi:hypothetical protein F3Y22_tig00113124pilonHSYRG00171 [Hibiscus syriacus]|uniref:Integrase catalytic domain-containing protein n=1 Tax=Hibiscus syriacus TaxID=106335 RepID=A0A6A2Y3I6_HIBSY|nr:hypothetical protein F3Y22_tig00113124pilonHSYRG00171 [Hibiscus syriacus]